MACDEALLESVAAVGRPILRFYSWAAPAASFGYFQAYADVSAMTALRPLVRRPTGGGLVPHEADWTYSVTIPPGDPWHQCKAIDSYRRMHEWLQAAFESQGIAAQLAAARVVDGPGQCFLGAEQYDLVRAGLKLAGAAQRRRRDGLLIQGSVQPRGIELERAAFEQAVQDIGTTRWNIRWDSLPPSHHLNLDRRVNELVLAKYSRDEYHRNRRWT
jgi:lipoate-protein ligase A